jgi:hypothetical protein
MGGPGTQILGGVTRIQFGSGGTTGFGWTCRKKMRFNRGARWPRGQCSRRAIVEAKQRSQSHRMGV